MGLRADSVHRPVLPIGQAHVLFAVRQLSGQKLAGKKKRHRNWDYFCVEMVPGGIKQLGKGRCEVVTVSLPHLAQVVFSLPEVEIAIQGHSTQFLKIITNNSIQPIQ